MTGIKNTPWTVFETAEWPFDFRIVDASGSIVHEEKRYAYSTRQNTIEDVYNGVGFMDDRDEVIRANAEQRDRILAMAAAVNAYDKKRALIETMIAALEPFGERSVPFMFGDDEDVQLTFVAKDIRTARRALTAAKEQSA